MKIEIRQITASETHEVRHPVLRTGLPANACVFSGDELESTFHLGAYENDQLLGVATFLLKSKAAIEQLFAEHKTMYQLRGMGILQNHQGKGIGKLIIQHAEDRLKAQQIQVLWFHARTSAVSFYKKLGYTCVGEELHLEPAGPHFKMYKEL